LAYGVPAAAAVVVVPLLTDVVGRAIDTELERECVVDDGLLVSLDAVVAVLVSEADVVDEAAALFSVPDGAVVGSVVVVVAAKDVEVVVVVEEEGDVADSRVAVSADVMAEVSDYDKNSVFNLDRKTTMLWEV
jgi:hypothetical protein